MPTLAVGHEDLVLARAQILHAQSEHLAAPQAPEEHGLDHGPVPVRAQRGEQRVHLIGRQDPRQCPRTADESRTFGARPSGGEAARDGVALYLSAQHQVAEQPRQRRQAALDGACRQTGFTVYEPDHRAVTPRLALLGDEGKDIGRRDLRWCLVDDVEERLQVRRRRHHGVVSGAELNELEISIQDRIAQSNLTALCVIICSSHRTLPSAPPTYPSGRP